MNWVEDTHYLQIDATSYCNAGCGTCARFVPETLEVQPYLKLEHFDMEVYKRLIEVDLKELPHIKAVFFNGNWGDAVMHPDLLEMCRIARRAGLFVKVSTNGAPRTPKWWSELAEIFEGKYGEVIFCIDGVGNESNAMYRWKTKYDKIIKNLRAFNDAGGNSLWVMTVFNYNMDQIDEAESLAREYGCFIFKSRKNYQKAFPGSEIIYPTHVVGTDLPNKSHYRTVKLRNVPSEVAKFISNEPGPWQSESQRNTQCPWYSEGGVQIDPHGTVWPCCITSQTKYGEDQDGAKIDPINYFANLSRDPKFSLKKNTLKEILADEFYAEVLEKKINGAAFSICVDECGVERL